jgi:hypothetical protein
MTPAANFIPSDPVGRAQKPGLGFATSHAALRLISRFGGVPELRLALVRVGAALNHSTIYRWTYPTARGGTGGRIPIEHWDAIIAAARNEGLHLDPGDFFP